MLTAAEAEELRILADLIPKAADKPSLITFFPRRDQPELFDQQTAFFGRNAKVAIAMGGNRSGKTFTAAMKLAKLVLWEQPPPWKLTPFVIVSDTYEQTCDVCWSQNLEAIIPQHEIDDISWHSRANNHPNRVILRPFTKGIDKRWVIEFHASKKGRRHLQGRKLGGCWFSEQFEWPIFDEVTRGCAHTWFDGAQFAEFTPVDPKLCAAVEQRRKQALTGKPKPLHGWKFYRLNTSMNQEHLDPGWFKGWFSQLDPNIKETRLTGAMPIFKGLVYPGFNPDVHILDDAGWKRVTGKWFPGTDPESNRKLQRQPDDPGAGRYLLSDHFQMKAAFPNNVRHSRSTDWGFTLDNAFCHLWGFRDGTGRWFIYDELFEPFCGRTCDRIDEIKLRWPWLNSLPDIYGANFCDSSRPDLINEFNLADIVSQGATHPIDVGVEHVRNHMSIERMKDSRGNERLETRFYVYGPNCPNLIEEIGQYQYIEGTTNTKNPRPGKPSPNPWNDHALDSLRYLIFGNRIAGVDASIPTANVASDPDRHGVRGAHRH